MATYIQRRSKGPAWFPDRWKRRYNVWHGGGYGCSVSLAGLDALLGARENPADFWACVRAADEALQAGDLDAVIEWPSGGTVIPFADEAAERRLASDPQNRDFTARHELRVFGDLAAADQRNTRMQPRGRSLLLSVGWAARV